MVTSLYYTHIVRLFYVYTYARAQHGTVIHMNSGKRPAIIISILVKLAMEAIKWQIQSSNDSMSNPIE